ncbi:MAG: cell division protein FtsH, partial [Chloroflexota bacterium]
PDVKGREEILGVHVRGKPLASDVDLSMLARATPGFVGADLENMVNEGAILAARKNKKTIGYGDLMEAIERVILGPERKSRVISQKERQITAYHEAGHAVVGHILEHADPVNKVTIIPRGMAGGVTLFLPDEEVAYVTRSRLRDQVVVALAGRAAEEIVFDEITTGASNDIQRVTQIARAMVARYGMSERLGPMMFGQKDEMVFLGREISEQRDYSEAVAEEIDEEVRKIVDWAYDEARRLIHEHRDKLEAVAERLLDVETLDRPEFEAIMNGEKLSDAPPPLAGDASPKPDTPRRDDDSNRPTLGNPLPGPA